MTRSSVRLLVILLGGALCLVEFVFWNSLTTFGNAAAFVVVIASISTTIILYALLAKEPQFEPYRKMTIHERRQLAESNAELAVRKGRLDSAMSIYEEVGLHAKALEIAHKLNDIPAQARISLAMGHHARARRQYLRLGDYETAGHCSLLMNEVDEARGYYAKAAEEAQKEEFLPEEVAALWDRAGEYDKAAEYFEEGGQLHEAAECYDLWGDKKNRIRCHDQARAVEAFEKRQASMTLGEQERHEIEKQAAAFREAEALDAKGDYYGAGIQYRIAGKMMEAGTAFEQIEEWERAARAFEEASLPDRAALAMMHVGPKQYIEEDDPETMISQLMAPNPATATQVAFNEIDQAQMVPVYLAATGKLAVDPKAQEEMIQLVRKQKFTEAAEKAMVANNWPIAAAFFECGGSLVKAADVYRQIGRTDDAVECLDKAGKPREAALLCLAEGRLDQAVRSLIEALDSGALPEDAVMMLLELLVSWGKTQDAVALLRTRIAPGSISVDNANTYYKFARYLESKDHPREALEIFKDMIAAGASSEDISLRMARLSKSIAKQEASGDIPEDKAPLALENGQESAIDELLITALHNVPSEQEVSTDSFGTEKTAAFAFSPPDEGLTAAGNKADGGDFLGLPGANMSLFGGPAGSLDATSKNVLGSDNGEAEAVGADREAGIFGSGQRYETGKEIARGGMGVVYEAKDTFLDRPVALKLILSQAATQQGLQQFLIEARAIAQLAHPNVVMIYDIGLMNMQHYIAMELIKGGSLSDLIKQEKQLSLHEAMRIFVETARGLRAAHEVGILHRDIKPGNLLLADKQQVKIVDFGLAKIAQEEGAPAEKTLFRSSGTPGFMSPEQIRGEKLSPSCDIYALGITLFQMLVGKAPHKVVGLTKGFDILKFQVDGDLPMLTELRPEVPKEINKIFQYCVAADPAERYQSIDTFLEIAEKWMVKVQSDEAEHEHEMAVS